MITAKDLVDKFRYALDNGWGYIHGTAGIVWTEARQKSATREMTVRYGKKWIGHHVADCSGLFTWAFKELGGYMYHGSNTMYRSYCTSKGVYTGQELKPGTAVFTGTEDNHGHVGLYIGGGMIIEAKGTQYGVVKTRQDDKLKNGGRRWTYWGELKGVDYSGEAAPAPEPGTQHPTLRKGSTGEYVTLAQTMLIQRGYDCGSKGADGKFGNATEKAVKAFQTDWDLAVDGVIGPKTWAMLESTPTKVTYTVTIPNLSLKDAEALTALYKGATMQKKGGD